MPDEDDLRNSLRKDAAARSIDPRTIDADEVIRRARRRRLPAQLAIGAGALAVVAAIAVPAAVYARPVTMTAAGSAVDAPVAPSADGATPPVEGASGGAPTPMSTPGAALPLAASMTPVHAAAGDRTVMVTLTLTNTSTERFQGSLSPYPHLVVMSADGTTIFWQGPQIVPMLLELVDLAPGESTSFQGEAQLVDCQQQGPLADCSTAPTLPAGSYAVNATVNITPQSGGQLGIGGSAELTIR